MKKLISMILMLSLSICIKASLTVKAQGQTRSVNNNSRFDDSRKVIYINDRTTDQVIFTDTIKTGRFVVDKRYNFTSDFMTNVPLLATPTITFKIKIGDAPAQSFISNAGMIVGLSGGAVSINGYFQRRSDNTVGGIFRLALPPTGILGLSLTSTSVNEVLDISPALTGDVPILITVSFSNNAGTTTLTRISLARSDF